MHGDVLFRLRAERVPDDAVHPADNRAADIPVRAVHTHGRAARLARVGG